MFRFRRWLIVVGCCLSFQGAWSDGLDFNRDGNVDSTDLIALLKHENTDRHDWSFDARFDLDESGGVTTADVIHFINRFQAQASPRTTTTPAALATKLGLNKAPFVAGQRGYGKPADVGTDWQTLYLRVPASGYGTRAPFSRNEFTISGSRIYYQLATQGELALSGVQPRSDIRVSDSMTISRGSRFFSGTLPFTAEGVISSGATRESRQVAHATVNAGPWGMFTVSQSIGYETQVSVVDLSLAGDWSTVFILMIAETNDLPMGYGMGGLELIYDEQGPVYQQSFYNVAGQRGVAGVERVVLPRRERYARTRYQRARQAAQQQDLNSPQPVFLEGGRRAKSFTTPVAVTDETALTVRIGGNAALGAQIVLRDASGTTILTDQITGHTAVKELGPVTALPAKPLQLEISIRPDDNFAGWYELRATP